MFLQSLTLKGFKSFAATTVVDFAPGLTVVVGPNGSGKSNIVDAISWVLGSQAPTMLRSQQMDDVIFAGNPGRGALGRAEVTLTLGNEDRRLPVDLAEVAISRTLFRGGESAYAINARPARLVDVAELLAAAGVGRHRHVIVSQGRIDAVLSAKPTERRAILEEAAGVSAYRLRKEKALRRLAETEANLARLGDQLSEVRRTLRPLEEQAEVARRHGEMVAELAALQIHLLGGELAGLRERRRRHAGARRDLADRRAVLTRRLGATEAQIARAESQLSDSGHMDLVDALARLGTLADRVRLAQRGLEEKQRFLQQRQEERMAADVVTALGTEAARIEAELATAAGPEAEIVAERERIRAAVEALAADEAAEATRRAGEQDAEEAAAEEAADAAGRAGEQEAEAAGPAGEQDAAGAEAPTSDAPASQADRPGEAPASGSASQAERPQRPQRPQRLQPAEVRARLIALEDLTARAERQVAQLSERRDGLARRSEAAEQRLGRFNNEVEALRDQESAAAEKLRVASTRQAEAAAAESAARRSHDDAGAAADRWESRAEALDLAMRDVRVRSGMEVLAGSDGVLGVLGDLVSVEEGWEAAFEAAAGEALAAAVVTDASDAIDALGALTGAGVAGAVLAAHSPAPSGGSVVGEPLRARVRARNPQVGEVLDALIGPVGVVEDWRAACDAALAHPGAIVVTRAGDCFSRTGWRVGTNRSGATGEALEEARTRLTQAGDARTSTGRALAAAEKELAGAVAAQAAAAAEHRSVTKRLAATGDRAAGAGRERASLETEASHVVAQLEELTSRLASHHDDATVARRELSELEAAERAAAEAARATQAAFARRRAALAEESRALDVRAAAARTRRRMLTERLEEIHERLGQRRAEATAAAADEHRAKVLGTLAETLAAGAGECREAIERLRLAERATAGALRALQAQLETDRAQRAELVAALGELDEQLLAAQRTEDELGLRIEALAATLRSEHDCDEITAAAAPQPELPEGTTAAQRVQHLQRRLRRIGAVNPLAVREYDSLKERHDLLATQFEDVRTSRRELNKVIRAIDAEILRTFSASYSEVADSFAELFGVLFDGGVGRLRLTEPDNPLESGVEIEAQPAGKNLRRLALLSGGERSLAALAFLFAIFRSQRCPFYVLDEVDAALDDVNLHRFLRLVQEFRAEAQLVLVSHQKPTMELADCLFGVTMRTGGTSRVISERRATEPGEAVPVAAAAPAARELLTA